MTRSTTPSICRARALLSGQVSGKVGANYIQGRVDKACLEVTDEPIGDPKMVKIKLRANLIAPYAVFLRN